MNAQLIRTTLTPSTQSAPPVPEAAIPALVTTAQFLGAISEAPEQRVAFVGCTGLATAGLGAHLRDRGLEVVASPLTAVLSGGGELLGADLVVIEAGDVPAHELVGRVRAVRVAAACPTLPVLIWGLCSVDLATLSSPERLFVDRGRPGDDADEVMPQIERLIALHRSQRKLAQASAAVEENARLLREIASEERATRHAKSAAIFALSKLAESRDPETGEHLVRMREYCAALARVLAGHPKFSDQLSPSTIENLCAASPLHDVGKVGIPDRILLKPGPLTPEEFEVMKEHTTIGADTLAEVARDFPGNEFIEMGIEIARHHHERWDGTGYPSRLKGTRIPLAARILAVGDVYDALTSRRVYKDAFSHAESRDLILRGRGTQFDPDIVDAFIECEQEFVLVRSQFVDLPKRSLV